MLEKFHLDWKIFLSNQTAKVMPSVYIWNQLEFVFSMCDCKAKVFAGLLVSWLLRWIFEANNFPVSNNFSSISMTSMHLRRSVKKKRRWNHFKHRRKPQTGCRTTTQSENRHLLILSNMTVLIKMTMQT